VPVVIASDDEGVARSNLTREFQRAATDYDLSYAQLKQMSGTPLSISFADKNTREGLLKDLEERFRCLRGQF